VSQIRLYIDEDSVERSSVAAFRASGLDRATVLEVNRQSFSDQEQLIWAAEQGRVIYSYNQRDFCHLHGEFLAAGKSHAGIILSQQQRYSVGQQLKALQQLILANTADTMINQLIFLSNYIK
jgi:hypothetical protein